MRTLANSEDPVEMPHDVAFQLSLHYLLRDRRTIFIANYNFQYIEWTIRSLLYQSLSA